MRLLLISDIHSNLEALNACLAVAPKCDLIANLGDIVGYGGSPNEVTAAVRKLGGTVIRGNHDKVCSGLAELHDFNPIAGMAALWTQQTLSPENMEWLRGLAHGPVIIPMVKIRPNDSTWTGAATLVQCVHGSPLDEDEYIIVVRDAQEPLQRTDLALTFFGHTHIQGGFSASNGRWATLRPDYGSLSGAQQFELSLERGVKYLINPGSVGQPRDGDPRAAFAVFDSDNYVVTFHRVPYDVERAQRHIYDANLPERLATRLADGR